ncbi:MAG: hypothetical protein ABSG94_00260 [Brevinematales bacterium]|jgi:hypothetical protein
MLLKITVTVLLLLGFISTLVTGIGNIMPAGVKAIPLIAAVFYWAAIYVHNKTGKTGIPGAALLLIFYVLVLISIPVITELWIGEFADMEKNVPAITIGGDTVNKPIFIVYHPGGSHFISSILTKLAGRLEKDGYKTVLYCVNKDLKIDLTKASAVGFASPSYYSTIRPPLEKYITNTGMNGVKSFIVISRGAHTSGDVEKTASELEKQGASVIGSAKFSSMEAVHNNDELNKLADEIEKSLK